MSRVQAIVFVVGLSVLFALIQIPARVVDMVLRDVNSPIELNGTRGSLWSGRASHAWLHWQGQRWTLGQVAWQVQPLSLLRLSACADFSASQHQQQLDGQLCADWDGSWQLSNASVSANAATQTLGLPVAIAGELELYIQELSVDADGVSALDAQGRWQAAQFFDGTTWQELGTLASRWSTDSVGVIEGTLIDIEGSIADVDDTQRTALRFQSRDGQSLSVGGRIKLGSGAAQPVAEVLEVLGYSTLAEGFVVSRRD